MAYKLHILCFKEHIQLFMFAADLLTSLKKMKTKVLTIFCKSKFQVQFTWYFWTFTTRHNRNFLELLQCTQIPITVEGFNGVDSTLQEQIGHKENPRYYTKGFASIDKKFALFNCVAFRCCLFISSLDKKSTNLTSLENRDLSFCKLIQHQIFYQSLVYIHRLKDKLD